MLVSLRLLFLFINCLLHFRRIFFLIRSFAVRLKMYLLRSVVVVTGFGGVFVPVQILNMSVYAMVFVRCV